MSESLHAAGCPDFQIRVIGNIMGEAVNVLSHLLLKFYSDILFQ